MTFCRDGKMLFFLSWMKKSVLTIIKKESYPYNRLWRPKELRDVEIPNFLENQLTSGGEVMSLGHRPPFTPKRFLVLMSVRGSANPGS
jgi:hypothetical protein